MPTHLVLTALVLLSCSACTSVDVKPLNAQSDPDLICIEENDKVIVGDFLSVVQTRIEDHGILTDVFPEKAAEYCDYVLTYVALQTWDMGTYMHHAELRLLYQGRRVAYAEYHLKGKGGLSLMKWKSTKSKMEPVVDELLGKTPI
ncbi:MAG: Sbal_3080 family lipoprotein [Pseudomonadota bacterium]